MIILDIVLSSLNNISNIVLFGTVGTIFIVLSIVIVVCLWKYQRSNILSNILITAYLLLSIFNCIIITFFLSEMLKMSMVIDFVKIFILMFYMPISLNGGKLANKDDTNVNTDTCQNVEKSSQNINSDSINSEK